MSFDFELIRPSAFDWITDQFSLFHRVRFTSYTILILLCDSHIRWQRYDHYLFVCSSQSHTENKNKQKKERKNVSKWKTLIMHVKAITKRWFTFCFFSHTHVLETDIANNNSKSGTILSVGNVLPRNRTHTRNS